MMIDTSHLLLIVIDFRLIVPLGIANARARQCKTRAKIAS